MLMAVQVPSFEAATVVVTVLALHAAEGTFVTAGSPLLDVSVDFSAGMSYDCPPVSRYRIILRDQGWLSRVFVAPGAEIGVSALMALLGTEPGDPGTDLPVRPARVTMASILHDSDWWGEPA